MSSRAVVDIQFRLSAPALPGGAEVRLRSFGERWVAVARSTTTVLLADLALLQPSVEIAR